MRYKIALVSDWYLPRVGGLELHLRDLARELSARGHEAHVICTTPGPARTDGVTVHRLGVPLLPWLNATRGLDAIAPLEQVLRQGGYDILHCQNAFSPLCHAGAYVAHKLGIPSVFTEQSVLRGVGVAAFRALDWLFGWTRWPTVLSAVSTYVAEDIRRVSGRREVVVLHNGVDPQQWVAPAAARRGGELRITSVLRFTRRKRPMDIISAIPRIYDQLPPGRRPRFTLVGGGPQQERVAREARRLGVDRYVELPGVRPQDDVRRILADSSLFVLPSIKEAHPRAVLEALAAGLPVVARKPNGVSDSVEHGREGYLAESLDEFADCIAALVRDDDLRHRMADNARKRLDRFCWDRVIEQHLQVYRLATQRCRGGHGLDLEPAEEAVPPRSASAAG